MGALGIGPLGLPLLSWDSTGYERRGDEWFTEVDLLRSLGRLTEDERDRSPGMRASSLFLDFTGTMGLPKLPDRDDCDYI